MGYILDTRERLLPDAEGAVNYSERNEGAEIKHLVLHYTVVDFQHTLNIFQNPAEQVSAHYLVPDFRDADYLEKHGKEPRAFLLVDEINKSWHAGISAWQTDKDINQTSIGIEVTLQFTEEQQAAAEDESRIYNGKFDPSIWPVFDQETQIGVLIELCQDIIKRNPGIKPFNVVGHSDIGIARSKTGEWLSLGRKKDPGPVFPWQRLAAAGVGLWPNEDGFEKWKQEFDRCLPSVDEVRDQLMQWGYYFIPNTDVDNKVRQMLYCLRMFQMRFRPQNMSGKLDSETAAILYDLVDQKKKLLA